MNIAIVSDEISRDFRTVVEVLKEINVKSIELRNLRTGRVPQIDQREIEELERFVSSNGITIQAISPGVGKAFIDSPDVMKESKALFHESVKFAKRFGIKRIIVFTFRKRDKFDKNEKITENIVEFISDLYDIAKEVGIEVVVENHSSCYVSTMESIIELANHPILHDRIKFNWDPNNSFLVDKMAYSGGLESIITKIESIHVKDTYYNDGFVRTPVFEGQVGWEKIFSDLSKYGYTRSFTSETHYEPRIANSKKDVLILREAVKDYFGIDLSCDL